MSPAARPRPAGSFAIDALLEAARWAPSSYNEQEWRFLYSHRDSPDWPSSLGLLAGPDQPWCGRAAVLGVMLSQTVFEKTGKSNPVRSFDAGSAFMSLSLVHFHEGPCVSAATLASWAG